MSTTSAYFIPNNDRPTWPTLDEVTRWAESVNSYPTQGGTPRTNMENMQLCLDAAVERISKHTNVQVRPVDSAGAVDPDGEPVPISARMKLATIMQTVAWYGRAFTPNGVLGSSELGAVIRVQGFDPGVERILEDDQELPY